MLPSSYLKLPREEKAYLIAAIQIKIEKDKKDTDKAKTKGRRKR